MGQKLSQATLDNLWGRYSNYILSGLISTAFNDSIRDDDPDDPNADAIDTAALDRRVWNDNNTTAV